MNTVKRKPKPKPKPKKAPVHRGRMFVKGQSGNPSGRPKAMKPIIELARTHTEKAIATLAGIMNNREETSPARVRAAEVLLDRAWGKATQPISGDDDAPPVDLRMVPTLSDAQLLAIIANRAQHARGR